MTGYFYVVRVTDGDGIESFFGRFDSEDEAQDFIEAASDDVTNGVSLTLDEATRAEIVLVNDVYA